MRIAKSGWMELISIGIACLSVVLWDRCYTASVSFDTILGCMSKADRFRVPFLLIQQPLLQHQLGNRKALHSRNWFLWITKLVAESQQWLYCCPVARRTTTLSTIHQRWDTERRDFNARLCQPPTQLPLTNEFAKIFLQLTQIGGGLYVQFKGCLQWMEKERKWRWTAHWRQSYAS